MQKTPHMPENYYRTAGFLILVMFAAPAMVQSESVFIDRPGKEFSSNRMPQTRSSQSGYDTAGQSVSGKIWFESPGRGATSQSGYPERNGRNSAGHDNPWRPDGRVYSNPRHRMRPWGGVPADAPAPVEQQQREYGRTTEAVPRYQPYYRYQPSPMMRQPMPAYGGYGNGRPTPYGAGSMPGYGGGGNQFFPFGSFGGMPGPGMPGGMFW